MARQYDVEDLLNSDASDPDGEVIPVATNDEVQEGKFIVETADGTGKIGNVSQIVADYLQKSAGFYTEVRPYYIVRPAPGMAWTGTWQLFLHGLDDGGLSDAANITIGINGVVIHTAPWTASSGARDIAFSISETESTALTASSPTGSNLRCYVAFHDTEGNEIVIRHFTLKLLTTVPKIPEDEIPNSIARDDEVTAAIAAALASHPGAFSDSLDLGTYENALVGAIAGHYSRDGENTRIDISYRNIAGEDKTSEINAIPAGYGLVFGDKIFVAEWFNNNASYREINGYWAAGEVDTTAESSQISVKVIEHELRMIRFMTSDQIKKLVPEIQQAYDKTVDIHLQETIGEYANMNDAAVAGISLVLKTTESDNALRAGTYNFGALTWETTSVDIPNDSNQYYVVVRIAKSQGRIETQFRVTNNSDSEPTEYLRGSIQDDTNWRYYRVVGDYDNVWTLQRRATTTHTRWDAPLGDIPVNQIQALIPEGEGLTPQQKAQFESLVAKTADILIETRETWVAATDASFLALPADNAQLARVRSGNTPIGLTGWTTDVTTTEARVILLRVPLNAQLADYRILLGDDNAVRLDTYGLNATGTQYAYMTSTSLSLQEATRIRLQHHGNATHTRFIGMLADAIMARLLPDPSGSTAGFVAKVNTALNGYVLAEETGSGGGLTMQQLADALADYVTQTQFRDYRPHTPDRGDTLPVHLPPQGTFVLQKTSHWSEKLYPFYPIGREIVIGGRTFNDIGTIEVPLSSELTIFESTDNPNPAIFSTTRVAGIYMRSTNRTATEAGYAWRPKIVLDRALFPSDQGAYDYSGLSIRMRVGYEGIGQYHHAALYHSAFNRDGDELSGAGVINELVAGGRTYVCFVPDNRNFHWRQFLSNAANNNAEVSFQILKSKTASPVFPPTDPQFLSDDPATAWVDGDEFETGLYEGDANGHPQKRILPPVDTWNHVVARSNTYFSGTGPDPAAGVDGQFWVNLRTGQIHQKQTGTWTLITDVALQTEISRAIDWSTIPNNTSIPANFMTKHSNRYFGAKLQHVKTSGSTAPTGDTTNWIELSNEVTTGTSAVAVEWSSIPRNTSIPTGTIVKHGRYAYLCITTHNKSTNGPDADVNNWQLLANYQGVWSAGYYHSGAITVSGTGVYLALHTVLNTDPAPNASTNVKWLQINNVEPPVRYIELNVNSGLTVAEANATAVPLTYTSTIADSNENTNFLTRNTTGNSIDLVPGVYVLDAHVIIGNGGQNERATLTVEIFGGGSIIKQKTSNDYIRGNNRNMDQSLSVSFTFKLASNTSIQVRVKKTYQEGVIALTTKTGSTVTVRKI